MNGFSGLIEGYVRSKQEAKGGDLCVTTWLDSASKRAAQISVATHVIKFSHGDARGTSVYAKKRSLKNERTEPYVTTDSLCNIRDDVVGNAAAMDVAGLLQLEFEGKTLLDAIIEDDSSPFAPFAENQAKLLAWMTGFKTALFDRNLSSDTLAKQVYFPTSGNDYHMLAPLYASSLSQALFERINQHRYGEKAKIARESRKNGEASDVLIIDFPGLAIQQFGGTKPQNISRLNSIRRGISFLLKSAPPIWKTIKNPPMKKQEFWNSYKFRAYPVILEFKRFLLEHRGRSSTKELRDLRQDYVDQLLDVLMQTAAEVQSMKPGWSLKSKIASWEKAWLDPQREDLLEEREKEDWKMEAGDCFARWISNQLEYKDLKFFDEQHCYFKNEFINLLKSVI